jgi:SAM-dependent methyltransferase
MMMTDLEILDYLSGKKLYGDDFTLPEIENWYKLQEGFYNETDSDLNYSDKATYSYGYDAFNKYHCFRFLKNMKFIRVLGFGSAYGEELESIKEQIGELTIIDISDHFIANDFYGKPLTYIKPKISGIIDFPDNYFDLVVCFGTLHHIANVSTVISEFGRVVKKGGLTIIREPINSMGDWRFPRKGISLNERGIPVHLFRKFVGQAGFKILRERFAIFKLTPYLLGWVIKKPVNNAFYVMVDYWLSLLFKWNINYHPANKFKTLRPTTAIYLLRKV